MADVLLERLVDFVAAEGMGRDRVAQIAYYLADRCADMSITTLYSSSTGSLQHDNYLVKHLGLDHQQISAWIALLRGTRAVRRRDGYLAGGCPGFIEVAATSGAAEDQPRFRRLARRAVGASCTHRALSKSCSRSCAAAPVVSS